MYCDHGNTFSIGPHETPAGCAVFQCLSCGDIGMAHGVWRGMSADVAVRIIRMQSASQGAQKSRGIAAAGLLKQAGATPADFTYDQVAALCLAPDATGDSVLKELRAGLQCAIETRVRDWPRQYRGGHQVEAR